MILILSVTITKRGKSEIILLNVEVNDVDQFALDYKRTKVGEYGCSAHYEFKFVSPSPGLVKNWKPENPKG